MVLIAPKLSESTVNSQLLKYFAKCQLDEQVGWGGVASLAHLQCDWYAPHPPLSLFLPQPGIRTNTNICLGKIASYLNPSVRPKLHPFTIHWLLW